MARAVRNFHLPLPEPLYQRLRDAAVRTQQPATTLARHAIETWLRQQRRSMVREAVAAYAVEVAGSPDDLDQDLESAALEQWRPEPPVKKRRSRRQA